MMTTYSLDGLVDNSIVKGLRAILSAEERHFNPVLRGWRQFLCQFRPNRSGHHVAAFLTPTTLPLTFGLARHQFIQMRRRLPLKKIN